MDRTNLEHLDPDRSDRSLPADILLREDSDSEEDDEKKRDRDEEDDEPGEGYSE